MPSSGSAARIAALYAACGWIGASSAAACSLRRAHFRRARGAARRAVEQIAQGGERALRVADDADRRPLRGGRSRPRQCRCGSPSRPAAIPRRRGLEEARPDRQDDIGLRQEAHTGEPGMRELVPVGERAAPIGGHDDGRFQQFGHRPQFVPRARAERRRRRCRSAGARPPAAAQPPAASGPGRPRSARQPPVRRA